MNRRNFIKKSILGTLSAGISPHYLLGDENCNNTNSDIIGPYWSDVHPQRMILANSDEPGTRIFISGIVTGNDCETPIQNAIVDVWHANDNGCYTIFQDCQSGNSENDPYNLRGYILTDENGYYGFESILPGYYAGRPRHFHYKITIPSGLELITQCYFENDPFIDHDWQEGHPGLIIPLEESDDGLTGVFNIVMDEHTMNVDKYGDSPNLKKEILINSLYPNPFNNSIRVDFTVNHSGLMDANLYDVTGKWILNLHAKHIKTGKHSITWKGTDMVGNTVPSGSYLLVIKFGNSIQTKKINFVK